MSKIEERLRVLEEKNAALEKRVADVEGFARVVIEAQKSVNAIADAAVNVKSPRAFAVDGVKAMVSVVLASFPADAASKARSNIAEMPDAMVHETLENFANTEGFPEQISENVRRIATIAREHSITFGELNLA